MSRENVELVRRCFDLFGRGEMEAVLQHVDPAMETIEPPEIPGSATYRGHSGLAKAYEHWRDNGTNVGGLVAYVFTVRDGKLARMQIFNTRAEALAAAGLRK